MAGVSNKASEGRKTSALGEKVWQFQKVVTPCFAFLVIFLDLY